MENLFITHTKPFLTPPPFFVELKIIVEVVKISWFWYGRACAQN